MTEPIQIYIQNVQYTGNSKQQWQSPTIILRYLFHTKAFDRSPSCKFSIIPVPIHF